MYFVILSRTFSAAAFSAACGGNTVTLSRTFLASASSLLYGQETLILSRTYVWLLHQYCMGRDDIHLVQDIFQTLHQHCMGREHSHLVQDIFQLLSSVLHGEGTQSSCPGHFSATVVSTAWRGNTVILSRTASATAFWPSLHSSQKKSLPTSFEASVLTQAVAEYWVLSGEGSNLFLNSK